LRVGREDLLYAHSESARQPEEGIPGPDLVKPSAAHGGRRGDQAPPVFRRPAGPVVRTAAAVGTGLLRAVRGMRGLRPSGTASVAVSGVFVAARGRMGSPVPMPAPVSFVGAVAIAVAPGGARAVARAAAFAAALPVAMVVLPVAIIVSRQS